MDLRKFMGFLRDTFGPYKPDPEKDAAMSDALNLLRHNANVITDASVTIAQAKQRADIRQALDSLGRAVSR